MPRGAQPKSYPIEQVEQVRRLYHDEGKTQTEIASELGMTQKIVWNIMRRHNIPKRVAANRDQRGEKNHNWKGDSAGYQAMHVRMTVKYGQPKRCQECGTTDSKKSYDWASMTGDFANPLDYKRLCRSCHWKLDDKITNITGKEFARG